MPATPTRDRIIPETDIRPLRRPEWIKVRAPSGETYERVHKLMRSKELHTVCEQARCPNLGECWGAGTATFLMLGDVCTRTCGFCDVMHGVPVALDWAEPERVARAVQKMNLKHAVITSVNRDERVDGGAPIFAMVIRRIRALLPSCSIEVLIPDFKGRVEALRIVMSARPEILNHNVETVPRLYRRARYGSEFERSKELPQDAIDAAVATQIKVMEAIQNDADDKTLMKLVRTGIDVLAEHVPELKQLGAKERDAMVAAKRAELTNPWFHSFVKFDPRTIWPKVKCPALALFGGNDFQVPAATNSDALKKAAGNVVTVETFDGLNHLFQGEVGLCPKRHVGRAQIDRISPIEHRHAQLGQITGGHQ